MENIWYGSSSFKKFYQQGKNGFNLNVKSRFSISSRLKLRVKQTMLNK